MLVLLALGTLVLLLDQNFLSFQWNEKSLPRPSWIESNVPANSLIRVNREVSREVYTDALSKSQIQFNDHVIDSIFASSNGHQAMSIVTENGEGRAQVSVPTPRLSIFLGLPVAINQAGYEELLLFPGIGPYVAGNIMGYREKHGRFSEAKELESVPGVGPKLASRISSLLIIY